MESNESTIAPAIASDEEIRPFNLSKVPQAELDELKRRVLATRWPEKETVSDQTQGVPLATMKALAHYWATEYDWRKVEAKLNAFPHFITAIDGLDIHFIHVRSQHENALPLIVTHGWPGSIIEQLKIIGPLTDPTAYGGKAEDAFHVVIPSIPGYGYSGRPSTTGWGPSRIAYAWVTLMKRLGYEKFLAQGGDWGGLITDIMAVQSPENLLGMATNFPCTVPIEINNAAFAGAPAPDGLSAEEKQAYDQLAFSYKHVAYALIMGSRPQTLLATADSPVGLATMFLDHDQPSLSLISRSFAGEPEGLTRDDVLDNITLCWLTNTAVSGYRIYWENKHAFVAPLGVEVPVVVSAFPDELYQAPQSWAEKAYPNLIYYKRHNKGGHFAAWEQPELLVNDIREGFRLLR
ncbi:alpha/beta fold hydrolase [Mucilaginibacter sabulilitoris]|uniref:Alpha/beta fold hydrolase n=1 Tax=Mucilaginibacter sabulilitoris TaxID=1173583 RepID=A0ABZ0TK66_9SPHI|nr:alpha/beta fold hydrolase [Mucilaginibacter sabulilitoris]WPU93219.1 alpha/beta fold hydrolase [Mucilaginibacter sabulilitoris]